jgi:flagellar motor switch protein FliN/FliY
MSITAPTSPADHAQAGDPAELAEAAARLAAPLVPAEAALAVGEAADVSALDPAAWKSAAAVELAGPVGGRVGLLVGAELAEALESAPGGAVDLGAALQPALDAAATALGVSAAKATALSGRKLTSTLKTVTVVVPLLAGEEPAAVLFLAGVATNAAPGEAAAGGADAAATRGAATSPTPASRGVEMLHGVAMEVTVELGRTRMSVRELLALSPGDVLELDRAAGSPADLLVNGRLIARGEVVVVDEDFALRVTEIVPPSAG